MKAKIVRFHKVGGPEVLQLDEVDVREPNHGEVRIRVKALGLNRAESMFRSGRYIEDPKPPSQLGYEAAGVVESVGAGVEGIEVGDAVSTMPAFSQGLHGVYGELALVPARAVVKHPASLSWEQAAAVWMQYLTAYGAILGIAKMKSGETLLIPAASSSVGLAAIQIANMMGVVPVALTRTAAKRQTLLDHGAKHVIVTDEQDVAAEVKKLTHDAGAHVAFDPVGGPGVAKLTAALRPHGMLILYGALSTEATPLPLFDVLAKSLTVRGYLLFELTGDSVRQRNAERFIVDGLDAGKLKPVIAKTFPLAQIVEAHRYMESNQQVGKIVVTV
jgi:NADPH:quinone reductase-like Zn-dependent oxidoreductase